MATTWYLILGLFFAGYFVLGGLDYGVGLLLRRGDSDLDRRATLNAVGPFFLGNEVWLVAAVGVLFGAFPLLEGELLSGLYPAVLAALAGVVTVTAAFQLRSRARRPATRSRWDAVLITGSTLATAGWGAVLGGLLQGVPIGRDGHITGFGGLLSPFVGACALALTVLAAAHGATFLAARLAADRAPRYTALARRLVPAAAVAIGSAAAVGLLSPGVRAAVRNPLRAIALLSTLGLILALAWLALRVGRRLAAFALSSAAMAVPVLLAGVATYPFALVSTVDPTGGLTVAESAAAPSTLALLSALAVPLLPALLGFQLMLWWAFRGRTDRASPVFW